MLPDADGDTISFRVKSINGGIKRGGNTIDVNGSLRPKTRFWTWTLPTNANGRVEAFSVVAHDNDGDSTSRSPSLSTSPRSTILRPLPRGRHLGCRRCRSADPRKLGHRDEQGWAWMWESAQMVEFIITDNDNPGLFSVLPASEGPNGTLTFTLRPGQERRRHHQAQAEGHRRRRVRHPDLQHRSHPGADPPVLAGAFKGTAAAPFLTVAKVKVAPLPRAIPSANSLSAMATIRRSRSPSRAPRTPMALSRCRVRS